MNIFFKNKKLSLLGLVLFFYGILVIPIMLFNNQHKQDSRGRAAEVTPTAAPNTCGNAPTDTVIIIDRSGSMAPTNKFPPTKAAAKNFIDVISHDTRNRVAVVSFSTTASLDSPLSNNYASAKSKIDALQPDGWTCIECALKIANQEIATKGRAGIKKVIVLLTDGQANFIEGTQQQVSSTIADQKALAAATTGSATSKTQFFTIGLGDPNATGNARFFNPTLLQNIAAAGGGKFYFPLPDQLNGVYNDISLLIGKATVSGYVYNDLNGNGVLDTGETKLSNQTVSLSSSQWGTKTTITDASGNYLFTSVCDGPYSLKVVPQSGWIQTSPTDPNGYSISITNGFSILDKNFGLKLSPPTATPLPTATATATPLPSPTITPIPTVAGTTTLSLTVSFDGIGSRGDNSNPDESTFSNKNPFHPIIKTDVQILNASNQLVATAPGVVTYSGSTGQFKGTVSVPSTVLPQGQYSIKVKAPRYLRKQVSGIQNIIPGQTNNITPVALVAGDINNDNRLDILDYNLLLDCYSDLLPAANCSN